MKPGALAVVSSLSLALAALPAAAQHHHHAQPAPAAEKIGQVSFPISCAPAAQKPFERAVALLHSFWYLEAVKGFTDVTQIDPQCAVGNRFKTLHGIARASELSGDRDRAKTYYAKLVTVAAASDRQRPELKQAQAFLGKP
jgi:hypothetical protein